MCCFKVRCDEVIRVRRGEVRGDCCELISGGWKVRRKAIGMMTSMSQLYCCSSLDLCSWQIRRRDVKARMRGSRGLYVHVGFATINFALASPAVLHPVRRIQARVLRLHQPLHTGLVSRRVELVITHSEGFHNFSLALSNINVIPCLVFLCAHFGHVIL